MNVFLLTLGTRGDVELFLLLGRKLRERGHAVTLGASPFYELNVEASGLEFLPIGRGTREELVALFRSLADVPDKRERIAQYAQRWVRPQLAASLADVKTAAAKADYFINNLRSVWRREEGIIPGACVTYDPVGDAGRIAKHAAQLEGYSVSILEIVALSKPLVDPDNLWPSQFQFTGFWFDDSAETYTPAQELAEFISHDPPPIVATFGSMLSFDASDFADAFSRALAREGQRGVLITSWAGLPNRFTAAPHLFVADEIPYEWLFPRSSLVIHHGGCGTVAAALCVGKPSVLLPQIPSQEYFAEILARQGLLVATLDASASNLEEYLRQAIAKVVHDASWAQRAATWRDVVQSEPGVARAVELIETHAAGLMR